MIQIVQVSVMLFTTWIFHIGTRNPNISNKSDYVPNEGVGSKFVVFSLPKIGQCAIWLSTLYQTFYLCLEIFAPSLISKFYPQLLNSAKPLDVTPIPAIGFLLLMIGGIGRIWCYKTLGKYFTFEITIRKSHQLIKSGPYRYVRHPSYTFASIITIGICFVHQRLKNFFPNQKWMKMPFGFLGLLFSCFLFVFFLLRRVKKEEEELKKTFGKEWNEYASQTTRFIPKLF